MPLGKGASAGDWIHDFVHSTNPQFRGKSVKERQRMALGAYYANRKRIGGLVNPRRFQTGGLFGGGTDTRSTTTPTTTAPTTTPPLFQQGAGITYSPGGMPQGGYNQATAAGDWWSPGGAPAGGTGFPLNVAYPDTSYTNPNTAVPQAPVSPEAYRAAQAAAYAQSIIPTTNPYGGMSLGALGTSYVNPNGQTMVTSTSDPMAYANWQQSTYWSPYQLTLPEAQRGLPLSTSRPQLMLTQEQYNQLMGASGLKGQAFLDAVPEPVRQAILAGGNPLAQLYNAGNPLPMVAWGRGMTTYPGQYPDEPPRSLDPMQQRIQMQAKYGYGSGNINNPPEANTILHIMNQLKGAGWDPSMGYGPRDWGSPSTLASVNDKRNQMFNDLLYSISPRSAEERKISYKNPQTTPEAKARQQQYNNWLISQAQANPNSRSGQAGLALQARMAQADAAHSRNAGQAMSRQDAFAQYLQSPRYTQQRAAADARQAALLAQAQSAAPRAAGGRVPNRFAAGGLWGNNDSTNLFQPSSGVGGGSMGAGPTSNWLSDLSRLGIGNVQAPTNTGGWGGGGSPIGPGPTAKWMDELTARGILGAGNGTNATTNAAPLNPWPRASGYTPWQNPELSASSRGTLLNPPAPTSTSGNPWASWLSGLNASGLTSSPWSNWLTWNNWGNQTPGSGLPQWITDNAGLMNQVAQRFPQGMKRGGLVG